MTKGAVHFSAEIPTDYLIDYLHAAETTGNNMERSASLFLKGPKGRNPNDYTYISVGADPPDSYARDAKSLIEIVERKRASWKNYELIFKGEITIDGIRAYRMDDQIIDIVPAITGDEKPGLEVFRRVDFDFNGYIWTIYIDSHSTTAEADKAHFEHILETFKILD